MSRKCPQRNRVFLNWLEANRDRFILQPQFLKIARHGLIFCFQRVPNVLQFRMATFRDYTSIHIEVEWHGTDWDDLGYFDASPIRSSQGWFCQMDEPEDSLLWPTREMLLIEHCFEPFLNWCNNTLVYARWLEIICHGLRAAFLYQEEPMGEVTMLNRAERLLKKHMGTNLKGDNILFLIRKNAGGDQTTILENNQNSSIANPQSRPIRHHIPPIFYDDIAML